MRKAFLPLNLILIIFVSVSVGYLINPSHTKTQALDSATKLMIMRGDTPERILSVPDGVGQGRFLMILGKTKSFIYNTTDETAGIFPKETIMSKMGESILGKEQLRIMRDHFGVSR